MNVRVVVALVGLVTALTAGVLLFAGAIESGPAALVGIIGIGLLATSGSVTTRRRSTR